MIIKKKKKIWYSIEESIEPEKAEKNANLYF